MLASAGRGVIGDLARRINLAADVCDLALERRNRLNQRAQDGKRRLELRDRRARVLDRLEVIGERDEAQRLERAPLDLDRFENLREIRRRTQRKARVIREKPRPFARRLLRRDDAWRVGHRMQLRQAIHPGWRDRQAEHHLNDPIKLECAKCCGVHLCFL